MEKDSSTGQTIEARYQKGLRRISVFVFFIGLVLVTTPFGIQYGVVQGLLAAGSKQVEIEDVDFNPFTGVLVIKDLRSTTGNKPELKLSLLSVQLDWIPLFKKQVSIRSLLLKGADLEIEQGKERALSVAGLRLPASEPKDEAKGDTASMEWGIGLGQVHFIDNDIEFKSADFSTDIKIDDLFLARLFSWKPGQAADFSFQTKVNSAPVSGSFKVSAFAERPLFKGQLKISRFVLDDFITLAGSSIEELKGQLSTDLSFSLSMTDSGINYHQQGSVSIEDSLLGMPDIQLAHQKAAWSGEVGFTLANGQTEIVAKGELALDEHQNSLNSPALDTKIKSTEWIGAVNFKQVGEENDLKVDGNFTATELSSQNHETELVVLKLNKLVMDAISVEQLENISLSKVVMGGMTVAKREAKGRALVKTEQIVLNKLQLQNLADVDLEAIGIDTLVADVNIGKQGDLPLLDELLASLKTKPPSQMPDKMSAINVAASADGGAKNASIRIGALKVSGKSRIDLTTATVSDSVKKKIEINNLSIGELDNRLPEKQTPIKLAATINSHAKLSLDGQFSAFSKKTDGKLTAKLKAIELPEFSPLIRHELGYDIQSGQLDADIIGGIKQNRLDGKIKIDVHKLIMEPADPDKTAKMAKQLAMPLDSALSLMRDENDDIKLEIPIKGDIAKPDFDIGDVINTALGNALQGTVTSYLKYALQPYGLIYMAAEKAYGAATSVSLEAVQFQPNEQLLSDQSKQYMERIGVLMQKRPGLRLRLCSYAVPNDRKEMIALKKAGKQSNSKEAGKEDGQFEAELLELAKARASAVKSHLISTYKVKPDRLFTCLPKVVKGAEQLPRVELLI